MTRLRTRIAATASALLLTTAAGVAAPSAQAQTTADLSSVAEDVVGQKAVSALVTGLFFVFMPSSMMSSLIGIPQCTLFDTRGC